MDKAHLTKWKDHTIRITFIHFSRPRIEEDDIIAIKVIGTALNKPNLPYIIFAKLTLLYCRWITTLGFCFGKCYFRAVKISLWKSDNPVLKVANI